MAVPLGHAIDGAQYVETLTSTGSPTVFGVWHGGHTVNLYRTVSHRDGDAVEAVASGSVGDFETGEVSLDSVKECMRQLARTPEPEV